MPASALRIVQLAKETGWTTAVSTATVKLVGLTDASLNVVPDVYQPTYMGTLAPLVTTALMGQHGEMSLTQAASYQDICYWLDGVFGTAAGSTSKTQPVWLTSAWVAGTRPSGST